MDVYVNPRYRLREITGVERYAIEITKRMPNVKTLSVPSWAQGTLGHFWEQLILPLKVPASSVLFSPCNVGPLATRNQVVTIHDMAFVDHPEGFSRGFQLAYRNIVPRLAQRCRHVLTVSEYSMRRIVEETGISSERVSVVHNGVDGIEIAKPETVAAFRNKYGLDKPYLCALGSITKRKNLVSLLRAWQEAGPKFPEFDLLVAGGTNARFAETESLRPNPQVTYLGRLADEDLPAFYTGATAFVFTSIYEGFGLPPLEAMMCGCPVISSNATAMPEVLSDAAILVDPLDVDQIAKEIERLLGDADLRRDLGKAGIVHAQSFTWDRAATETSAVVERYTFSAGK